MGELEDLREARRIVREMIESARVRMRKQVAAALTIIGRPGNLDGPLQRFVRKWAIGSRADAAGSRRSIAAATNPVPYYGRGSG